MDRHGLVRFFSAGRVYEDICAIWGHARWCTGAEIVKAAEGMVARLEEAGVPQVELVRLPADGRTAFGGWVMPRAWDGTAATLEITSPATDRPMLAEYATNPHSLMMWSPPTPRGGVEAEVVRVEKAFEHRGSLKGKIALVDGFPQIGVYIVEWLAARGAVGVISDSLRLFPGVKEGAYLDDASQYHNYANAPWEGGARLPGFSITPRNGRHLRRLLARGPVRVRARVSSRLYAGVTPLVNACVPGSSGQEIVLTGHMDEPGAEDNASGAALAMELLRCAHEQARRLVRPLRRGVRVILSMEARGLQAYLNTRPAPPVVAGLDLDMLGCDHTAQRTSLDIASVVPSAPSFFELLMADEAKAEQRRGRAFRWKVSRGLVVNDCQFAMPPFSAPMLSLDQAPNRTYHTNLDTPKVISRSHLARLGRMTAPVVGFLADADAGELRAVARRVLAAVAKELARDGDAERLIEGARRQWGQLLRLVPEGDEAGRAALSNEVARLEERLARHAGARRRREVEQPKVAATELRAARRMVPRKAFVGYLGFEGLSSNQRRRLKREAGIEAGWAAPHWADLAVVYADGQRSADEIFRLMRREGQKVELARLVGLFRFLARLGQVEMKTARRRSRGA